VPKKDRGGELFIVDNSDDDWKVRNYIHEWCEIAKSIDVATGYFEIGSLLSIDGQWQKLDNIRILMGDEISARTKQAFLAALQKITEKLDISLESEKESNDFLVGVPAIVEALRSGKITCRVYKKKKFHAKAYITHGKLEVVGSAALVGSSNFTRPGFSQNVELNIQIRREVDLLQEWFEKHWDEAEDVTPDILKTVERHTREYTPFEVYAKSLHEFYRGHELTAGEFERTKSRMFPVLDQYQKEGYQAVMKIAQQYRGAFLCDGVGLGKTFVGLMLIERLIMHDRKRVALFVPKAAREDVWERDLKHYLGYLYGDFSNLVVFNHTDLGRGGEFPGRFNRIKEIADVVIIDEAHHFRNQGVQGDDGKKRSRYWTFYDLLDGPNGPKQVFMLTATPINNLLKDFHHMVQLFSREHENYFGQTLGIQSLRGHFIRMDRALRRQTEQAEDNGADYETNLAEAEQVLKADQLFQALVVQRSRAYVKRSQEQEGASITMFPIREPPQVVDYSVRKTYGNLLDMIEKAFDKKTPLFALGLYYPLAYFKGDKESLESYAFQEGRQKQVVILIRTQFLKRFESSSHAFERSCDRLLLKLLAWVTRHSESNVEKRRLEKWRLKNEKLLGAVNKRQLELFQDSDEEEFEEDIITEEMLEDVELLQRDEYRVDDIIDDTYFDLDTIVDFLKELRKFKPSHDDKLKALIKLLKSDAVLKKNKVLIFSEFAETARYLDRELVNAGIEGVEQIDSNSGRNRGDVIRRFAPYYNGSTSTSLATVGRKEIRVLISTDVLSEGLNLQDATRLINYDLHWNPVRLMQRIGRVDRRMNPAIEEKLLEDHPDQKKLRGNIAYWNFLPPDDLEGLLHLYSRVSRKTLQISKTLGIEGKKLLKPGDDFAALKEFNASYDGTTSQLEEMHLEYQKLLKDYPDLAGRLDKFPGRVFSGKAHPSDGVRAVFFCFRIPRPDYESATDGEIEWTEEAGDTKWYLYDLNSEQILEEPTEIVGSIRSDENTPRICKIEQETLSEIRAKIEKHIINTILKQAQAPVGVDGILKTWMELN
jgi:superfamily II DNA or RNA helicase